MQQSRNAFMKMTSQKFSGLNKYYPIYFQVHFQKKAACNRLLPKIPCKFSNSYSNEKQNCSWDSN